MNNPIRRSAAPLTEEAIRAAEVQLGLMFPADYREFLLQHNGGYAQRDTFHYTNHKGRTYQTWLGWIYCIGDEGKVDPADHNLFTAFAERPGGLPDGMLPVAYAWHETNTGFVCLACEPDAPEQAGKVFFRPDVDPGRDTVYEVADSWWSFLSALTGDKVKKWKQAIRDGDADRLRALLERSDKWQGNVLIGSDIEEEAVEEGHWSIVEVLLDKGWSASSLFTQALGRNRFELARRLLHCGEVAEETIQESLMHCTTYLWYDLDFVAELVGHGADLDHETSLGETPLHSAVESGNVDAVRFLVERGVNPTVKNHDGRTPLALARRLEEPRMFPLLQEAERRWAARPVPRPEELEVTPFDYHGVSMSDTGPALTIADIAAFEQETGIELPPAYRGFLLSSNGGTPNPDRCPLPSEEDADDMDDVDFDDEDFDDEDFDDEGTRPEARVTFVPLLAREDQPFGSVKEAMQSLRETGNPRRMLPIGHVEDYGISGGLLLISCKGKDRGRLYYRDGCLESHEDGGWPLLDSLDALFSLLGEVRTRPATPNDRAEQAIRSGDMLSLRDALNHGVRINKPNSAGETLLQIAMLEQQDDAVLLMLDLTEVPLDRVFLEAIQADRLELVRKLLGRGKGPSRKAIRRGLIESVNVYHDPELLRTFVDRGIDVKKQLPGGQTYLHMACYSGNIESVRFLLEKGADINARAESGETPLYSAAAGAIAHPSAYADQIELDPELLPEQESAAPLVRFLLEQGARANVANAEGETALHQAVRSSDIQTAKLLIDAGEDLDAQHELFIPGMTPEKQAQMARQSAKYMQEAMQMFQELNEPDADAPPPPDTSTPLGEMLAHASEAMEQMKERIAERADVFEDRLHDLQQGSMGKGPSAAEYARHIPDGEVFIAELREHIKKKG